MKTIKIIDLLLKIANGEEVPKKIKYLNTEWDIKYLSTNNKSDYYSDDEGYLSCSLNLEDLNNEVEIIEDTPKEEKKIEKIDISNFPKRNNSLKKTALKVNEIIDYINKEK